MSKNEVIYTDPTTGAQKAGNLQRPSLVPSKAFLEIAEHYGKGSLKYAEHNWRKGMPWSWSYDALDRHLKAFWGGEDYDACTCTPPTAEPKCPDCGATGSKHIIAVAWHAIALATFMDEHPELDDRYKAAPHD